MSDSITGSKFFNPREKKTSYNQIQQKFHYECFFFSLRMFHVAWAIFSLCLLENEPTTKSIANEEIWQFETRFTLASL